jgi:alkanesulfonate monooxygenase SsuD/methylene tetrahydromethanopterin reductase-like flavin-dependent oxidoreductase (luciferase family)
VLCRPTRREAEEFYHYFAEETADAEGQAYYRRQRGPTVKDSAGNEIRRPLVNRFMRATGKRYDGAYPGAYPQVGTPDDIVADMQQMSELGWQALRLRSLTT